MTPGPARHARRRRPAGSSATGSGTGTERTDGGTPSPDDRAGDSLAPTMTVRQIFQLFRPYLTGYRLPLAVGTVLVALSVPLETTAIWLFKILVDEVLQPRDFAAFPRLALGYVGLTVVMGAVSFAAAQVMTRASEGFLLSVRTRVLEHLHTLSPDFFQSRRLGDLLSRVGGDVASIEALVLTGVSTAVGAGLRVLVFGVMLLVVDPLLALAAIVVSPLFWLVGRHFSSRLKAVSRESRHRIGMLSSLAEESLANVETVQAYNRQPQALDRFHREGEAVLAAAVRSSRLRGLYGPLVDLVELAGLLVVIGVGTWQLTRGTLTLGALLVFMAYFAQLYAPLRELGSLANAAFTASAGAERIAEILRTRPRVRENPRPWPAGRVQGLVELRNVGFSYPGSSSPALLDVSFTAHPGQLVAVVGASGSGKSTLTRLLLRFFDPTRGAVLLDGQDVRFRTLADLRDQIGVVLQETAMLDGTLRDNILWGAPGADDDDLARAVRAADVDTVVAGLPGGLDTPVGQRGRRLSGGQRQRVAIARAMIRDAPVLVLDEPCTGLDPATRERVMTPLRRLMAGRTTLLVSHDVLAARDADLVLVMAQGRIVESGRYDDLLALGGTLFELVQAQLRTRNTEPGETDGGMRGGAPPRVKVSASA